MSDVTTIKVSAGVRDRLRAQAVGYRTMDEYLDHLLSMEDRRRKVASLRAAIAATSAEGMASWRAESKAWESASVGDEDDG